MLFTYFAITSFFSRHLFCKLGDFRYFNRFHLYQGGMTISGLCVLCLPLANSFGSIVAIFLVNGLMDGAMQGQISLMVLQCTGKHNIIHGWGYTMFFTGLTTAIGPPLAGEFQYEPSVRVINIIWKYVITHSSFHSIKVALAIGHWQMDIGHLGIRNKMQCFA